MLASLVAFCANTAPVNEGLITLTIELSLLTYIKAVMSVQFQQSDTARLKAT